VAIVAGAAVLFTGIDPRRRHGGWGWIVHGRSWCRWSSLASGGVTVLGRVGPGARPVGWSQGACRRGRPVSQQDRGRAGRRLRLVPVDRRCAAPDRPRRTSAQTRTPRGDQATALQIARRTLPPTAERQSPQRCCGQPLVLFATAQPIAVPAPMRAETATAGEAIATVPALARTPAYDSAVARHARAAPGHRRHRVPWHRYLVTICCQASFDGSDWRFCFSTSANCSTGRPVRACLQRRCVLPEHLWAWTRQPRWLSARPP